VTYNSFNRHHERNVHGPRPYGCSICEQKFVFPKDLARHSDEIHGDVRNHFCPDAACKYHVLGFKRKEHLERHRAGRSCPTPFTLEATIRRHVVDVSLKRRLSSSTKGTAVSTMDQTLLLSLGHPLTSEITRSLLKTQDNRLIAHVRAPALPKSRKVMSGGPLESSESGSTENKRTPSTRTANEDCQRFRTNDSILEDHTRDVTDTIVVDRFNDSRQSEAGLPLDDGCRSVFVDSDAQSVASRSIAHEGADTSRAQVPQITMPRNDTINCVQPASIIAQGVDVAKLQSDGGRKHAMLGRSQADSDRSATTKPTELNARAYLEGDKPLKSLCTTASSPSAMHNDSAAVNVVDVHSGDQQQSQDDSLFVLIARIKVLLAHLQGDLDIATEEVATNDTATEGSLSPDDWTNILSLSAFSESQSASDQSVNGAEADGAESGENSRRSQASNQQSDATASSSLHPSSSGSKRPPSPSWSGGRDADDPPDRPPAGSAHSPDGKPGDERTVVQIPCVIGGCLGKDESFSELL
jgi:hypothetical protein